MIWLRSDLGGDASLTEKYARRREAHIGWVIIAASPGATRGWRCFCGGVGEALAVGGDGESGTGIVAGHGRGIVGDLLEVGDFGGVYVEGEQGPGDSVGTEAVGGLAVFGEAEIDGPDIAE